MRTQGFVVSVGMLSVLAGSALGQSFTEVFDAVDPLFTTGGWFGQNNSEAASPTYTAWQQGVELLPPQPMSAHSGAPSAYALANYQATIGTAGTEDISVWMVPPMRLLKNGDQIKFWVQCVPPGATIYPDRMQVRLSTNGNSTNVGTLPLDVGDFTTLLLDINPTYNTNPNPGPPTGNPPTVAGFPTTWTQYTLTLSGLPNAGVNGRFAFRYFVEDGGIAGPNSNLIGVDDLEYIAVSTGATCYPNCDSSTTQPCLNVQDFGCFLNSFSNSETYANCDLSTTAPVLNVQDFGCFLNSFSSGCSSC